MPNPPWNFSTLTSRSPIKLFGANITEISTAYGAPGDYTWAEYLHEKWNSGAYSGQGTYANWILPRIKDTKSHNGNIIRMPGALYPVLTGSLTMTALKANYTQLFNDLRAIGGMSAGLNMSANNTAGYGIYSTANWCVPLQDLWTNIFVPYQDVIAYIECGLQESDANIGPPQPATLQQSVAIMQTMQTFQSTNGYNIPLLLSASSAGSLPNFIAAGANPDLWGMHFYPNTLGVTGLDWVALRDACGTSWSYDTTHAPIIVEEYGLKTGTGIGYQQKADYYNNIFEINFGHPDIAGVINWTSDGFDGDWTYQNIPAFPGGWSTDPTVWTETVCSQAVTLWNMQNRPLLYPISLNGSQSVTSTATRLSFNLSSRSTTEPTVTNVDIRELIFTLPYTCTFTGTFSFTGDAGTTYTLTLYANNDSTDTRTIGTATWTGTVTNKAVNISAPFPGGTEMTPVSAYRLQAQATGGSLVSGTMTALSGNMIIGNFTAGAGVFGGHTNSIIRPKTLVAAAMGLGIINNPPLTRRRALNPLTWTRET